MTPDPAAASPDSPHDEPALRWQVAAADFSALQAGPVLVMLDDHAVLEFDGPDTVGFLQGQTTADMAALVPAQWQLGGYCTPKGRLLAIFHAWRYATGIRMLLPESIAAGIHKRLAMYVLRAKVQVRDASTAWSVAALCGKGSAAALSAAGVEVPDSPWQCTLLDADERVVRLPVGPQCPERLLLVMRTARLARWRQQLALLPVAGNGLWWWTQIDAAQPAILAPTQERFVPQGLNLEVLGGVNFRKGCYPGKEIVARSQYLGKLRRRMAMAHAAHIGPAADVFQDGESQAVGRTVLAATAPAGGWDLLFECPTERLQGAALRAGAADASVLQLRELPYPIFDPTA